MTVKSVKSIIDARRGTMAPGDVYVMNNPYNGGTHIPDVTVITPVFSEEAHQDLAPAAAAASRATDDRS